MADKKINTRIIHKHDIEENWLKAINFIPQKGEIIVYDIDGSYTYSRIKIGDGVTPVNNLPYVANKEEFVVMNDKLLFDCGDSQI